ncbi:MAG: HepT-like ribonuclease domain-containing protein [Acetobacteraceae bacterium]
MTPDDAIRIRHMIEAAETAQRFIAGRKRADLDSDAMLLFAVVQAIQIVGEAASRISPETRSAAPSVPWARIIGMRHRLIHAYADIEPEVVWRTASAEIPALLTMLVPLLPKD